MLGMGPWSEQDRLLALALTAHEDSLCGGCGQPKDQAYNPDAQGWFEARAVVCAGCAARDEHGKEQKTRTAGEKVYVVDTLPADRALAPWRLPS